MPHGDEIALLLRAARPVLEDDDVTALRDLVKRADATLDWGFVVDQAYRHNVLSLLGRNMLRYRLHPGLADGANFLYEEMFSNAYHANQVRNEAFARELVVILGELAGRGICPVVRKGAVLGQEVFGDVGVRRSYDIDLMAEPGEVAAVEEVMAALGYEQGNLAANRRSVKPRTRSQEVFWSMRVPKRQFHRPASERFVGAYIIDLALNQFFPGSGYDLPAAGLDGRSRPIRLFGAQARAFTHEEMVIDLTTHLFKEATSFYYMRLGKDLTLSKFLDVATYARTQPVDWPAVYERASAYRVTDPVYFALYYTEVIYPGSVPPGVLELFQAPETTFLREFGRVDRDVKTWQGDFIARLFDTRRAADLPPSRIPM